MLIGFWLAWHSYLLLGVLGVPCKKALRVQHFQQRPPQGHAIPSDGENLGGPQAGDLKQGPGGTEV